MRLGGHHGNAQWQRLDRCGRRCPDLSLELDVGADRQCGEPSQSHLLINPTFTVDKPGSYVAQIIVNDGQVDSLPSTVTITTQNSPPVANAGPDQTVFVGTTVTLDGSGSTDVDGDLLSYHWSLITVPEGSAASLSDATAVSRPSRWTSQAAMRPAHCQRWQGR